MVGEQQQSSYPGTGPDTAFISVASVSRIGEMPFKASTMCTSTLPHNFRTSSLDRGQKPYMDWRADRNIKRSKIPRSSSSLKAERTRRTNYCAIPETQPGEIKELWGCVRVKVSAMVPPKSNLPIRKSGRNAGAPPVTDIEEDGSSVAEDDGAGLAT